MKYNVDGPPESVASILLLLRLRDIAGVRFSAPDLKGELIEDK